MDKLIINFTPTGMINFGKYLVKKDLLADLKNG
jgi:hypothetical protein